MKYAQRLYEQGLITYHRTDNPNISKDSMPDIRAVAKALGLKCVEQQRCSSGPRRPGRPPRHHPYRLDGRFRR
ncbi:DNA topoisomerase [Microbulbifer taiwanensis]|uniref:DNA topoisomerase n=1 Tax=Microbulbifer taiwanensis TaxID=986746 RepID=A0ABW1YU31_9GAMM